MGQKIIICLNKNYNCTSTNCRFRGDCAQHQSAGEFIQLDGFKPKLELFGDDILCETAGSEGISLVPTPNNIIGYGYWTRKEIDSLAIDQNGYSAEEMRKTTISAIDVQTKADLIIILNRIKEIALDGKSVASFNMTEYPNLEEIMKGLTSLGYNVNKFTHRADDDIRIEMRVSW